MSKSLQHADIIDAANQLAVEPAAISAVDQVESRGSGFLADGRPKILFERHIMRRRLQRTGRHDLAHIESRYPAVVSRSPGGYKGGAGEWRRLETAREIDRDCADESCSWGRYQIMGFHWSALGYDNITAFVAAMSESEARQLQAFVRFIQADPKLLDALRAKRWADFARRYNGPNYQRNAYDEKLAVAYTTAVEMAQA